MSSLLPHRSHRKRASAVFMKKKKSIDESGVSWHVEGLNMYARNDEDEGAQEICEAHKESMASVCTNAGMVTEDGVHLHNALDISCRYVV